MRRSKLQMGRRVMVGVYVGGPPIVGIIVEGPLVEGDLVRFKVSFRDFESWYAMDGRHPTFARLIV